MKTQSLLLISFMLLASCNYRVFDLAEYPDLKGTAISNPFETKATEPTYASIYQTVLQDKCLSCHKPGSDSEKASKIPLVTYQDLMAMNEDGLAIVAPGQPENSLLYLMILPTERKKMPPTRSGLAPVEPVRIEAIRAWIAAGAPEK